MVEWEAQYHIFVLAETMAPVDSGYCPSFGREGWVWAADKSKLRYEKWLISIQQIEGMVLTTVAARAIMPGVVAVSTQRLALDGCRLTESPSKDDFPRKKILRN